MGVTFSLNLMSEEERQSQWKKYIYNISIEINDAIDLKNGFWSS